MLSTLDIEEMNRTELLDLNPDYCYYLENLSDGYGVIRIKANTSLEKDAVICCKPISKCLQMLATVNTLRGSK